MGPIIWILVVAGMAACVQAGPAPFHHQSRFLEGLGAEEIERLEVAFAEDENISLASVIGQYERIYAEPQNISYRNMFNPKPSDIVYTLYTKAGNTVLDASDVSSIDNSDYDVSLLTFILIHGWTGSLPVKSESLTEWMDEFVVAAIETIVDVNVITVDWSILSQGPYTNSKRLTGFVASQLVNLLSAMDASTKGRNSGYHLIGHGMGAHIAGMTGQEFPNILYRISGLDPAGFRYQSEEEDMRLNLGDAQYVDIIHTDPLLGYRAACGDHDFYVNGGLYQRGCKLHVAGQELCNHKRATDYFIESLTSDDYAYGFSCKNILNFVMGRCLRAVDSNAIGFGVAPDPKGSFYMTTRKSSPFFLKYVELEVKTKSVLSLGRVVMSVVGTKTSFLKEIIRITDFIWNERGTVRTMFSVPLLEVESDLDIKLKFVPYMGMLHNEFTLEQFTLRTYVEGNLDMAKIKCNIVLAKNDWSDILVFTNGENC